MLNTNKRQTELMHIKTTDTTRTCVLTNYDASLGTMASELRELALKAVNSGNEIFLYRYRHDTKTEAYRTLGRHASDKELSFSWYDAAICSQVMRTGRDLPGLRKESDSRLGINRLRR